MNRKIIIIIAVLICLCTALITAQHFANKDTENTTAPTASTEAPQTDAPAESTAKEHSTAPTEKEESATQTAETSSKNSSTMENTSSSAKHSETKQQSTKAQSSEKNSTSQTTKKPQSTTSTTKPKATTTEPATKAEKPTITVTISINCEKALGKVDGLPESGYFLAPCKFTVNKGTTAFDVLETAAKENGITLKYQSKSYIQAINGLAEKDCGGSSGWTYKVNGVKPNKSAAKYELADGDIVEWYYVTSPND